MSIITKKGELVIGFDNSKKKCVFYYRMKNERIEDIYEIPEEKEYLRNSFKISILINVIRFILIAIIAFVFALLEYVYFIKIANIFDILGGYLIPLVVYIIVLLIKKEK